MQQEVELDTGKPAFITLVPDWLRWPAASKLLDLDLPGTIGCTPGLWAKTNPFSLHLFLPEHFTIATGKEKPCGFGPICSRRPFLCNIWGSWRKRSVPGL